jgi:DNA polymerase III delta prime subunit
MTDTLNIPWIEKYRPNNFEKIVLDPYNRCFFENIIKTAQFPNLLFYGPPGTGKTTTIINLIYEYQEKHTRKNRENIIHLNASDERGIDVIRNQINQFAKSKHLFEVGMKFVILDEVDYMTDNAQHALKSLLQTSRSNVRFCLICNYISKIDESLQSEFICVRFNQLPKREICEFIDVIIKKENMNLTEENIETIREIYDSDIRSMINYIQFLSEHSQNLILNSDILSNAVWEYIHNMFLSKTRQTDIEKYIHMISIKHNMDKKTIFTAFFNYTIRNKPEIVSVKFLNIVETVVHSTNNIPIKTLLDYFCSQLIALYAFEELEESEFRGNGALK